MAKRSRLTAIFPGALFCLLLLLCGFALSACNATPGGGGVNSAPGITDRINTVTVRPLGLATVTASCQGGEQMLSGGWAVTTPAYRQDTVPRGGILHTVIDDYFIVVCLNSGRFSALKKFRQVVLKEVERGNQNINNC